MPGCLDASTLAAFAAGSLSPEADAAAEQHLGQCRRCAAGLARLDNDAELVERVRAYEASRNAAAPGDRLRRLTARVGTTLFGAGPQQPEA